MSSKGEEKIASILKRNKISFKREFVFQDLKSLTGNPLRFDFAVFKNKQLIALIEFDGEQHFKQVPHFQKTIFDFRKTLEWDRRKNSYCIRKKIPLIRIPYWDLDKITLHSIFNNSQYRVYNKNHNDLLRGEKI